MAIGLFALTFALITASGVAGGFSKNHNETASDDAFYAAEAAMREGAYQYEHVASAYTGGSFPLLNGVNSSTVTIVTTTWPYVNVIGAANGRGNYRTVTEMFTIFPEGLAFDHAIYAEYNLQIGGNVTVNGGIFANGAVDFKGTSATVNGDAVSASTVTENGNVAGSVVDGANPIPPPAIDIAPYVTVAQADGTYFTSSTDAEAYLDGNTRQAVVVVGDTTGATTKLSSKNTNLTGSLVVEGDLDLSGGTYTATSTYAAVVVYGDLKVSGGTTINGIVYTTGQVSFGAGNNVVNGAIISTNAINLTSLTGNLTVNFDPSAAANWQSLLGLSTTTTSTPQPIQWSED
jgi:hypothetical protein